MDSAIDIDTTTVFRNPFRQIAVRLFDGGIALFFRQFGDGVGNRVNLRTGELIAELLRGGRLRGWWRWFRDVPGILLVLNHGLFARSERSSRRDDFRRRGSAVPIARD